MANKNRRLNLPYAIKCIFLLLKLLLLTVALGRPAKLLLNGSVFVENGAFWQVVALKWCVSLFVYLEPNTDRKRVSHTRLHTINKDTSTFTVTHISAQLDSSVYFSRCDSESHCVVVLIFPSSLNRIKELHQFLPAAVITVPQGTVSVVGYHLWRESWIIAVIKDASACLRSLSAGRDASCYSALSCCIPFSKSLCLNR